MLVTHGVRIQSNKDKESAVVPERHDDTVSDIAEAFLNRMQIFTVKFEVVKVSLMYIMYVRTYA